MSLRKSNALNCLCWMVVPTMILMLSGTFQSADAQKKQYLFRRSNEQGTSTFLGISGVPAGVNINGRVYNGVYITSSQSDTATRMGLSAGAVLLTIGKRSIDNATLIDAALTGRRAGQVDYSYVPWSGSKPPTIVYGRFDFSGGVDPTAVSSFAPSSVSSFAPSSASNFAPSSPSNFAPQSSSSVASTGKASSIDQLERQSLDLVNKSRREGGSGTVSSSSTLMRLARNYAEYMMKHKTQYMNPVDPHRDLEGRLPMQRAKAAGINCEVHENLGMESRGIQTDLELVTGQHNKMMSEPPNEHNHRSILMDKNARYVGIGVARDGDTLFLVQEFGTDSQ